MSQITGEKRVFSDPKATTPAQLVSVGFIDHKQNAGLDAAIYPGPLSRLIETIGTVTYIGECAPGFSGNVDDPIWRIQKIDKTVVPTSQRWATLVGVAPVLDAYATFQHAWADRAALTYA